MSNRICILIGCGVLHFLCYIYFSSTNPEKIAVDLSKPVSVDNNDLLAYEGDNIRFTHKFQKNKWRFKQRSYGNEAVATPGYDKNRMLSQVTGGIDSLPDKLYVTAQFRSSCAGSGLSNKLYEFISLYGIARSLYRFPYADAANECMPKLIKEMTSYFPRLANAIELRFVQKNVTKYVNFSMKCCNFEDVNKLLTYNSSQYLFLTVGVFQSYKFFDKYKSDVIRLLEFISEDKAAAQQIALDNFKSDADHHRICVHVRRGDFMLYGVHEYSTESFTTTSVFYVRAKLKEDGKNTTVAILGDDRAWAQAVFANYSWVRVPTKAERATTDYAFFARYCQTIILTASASTFGFWSAYLSSAEKIYYNVDYAKSEQFRRDFVPADIFPPTWIPLKLNSSSYVITEIMR